MPGFSGMEATLSEWLRARYGSDVELFYAHGLRQSPRTLSSTGFDVHQARAPRLAPRRISL